MKMQKPAKPILPPILTEEQKKGLVDYWECYQKNYAQIQTAVEAIARKIPDFAPIMESMDPKEKARRDEEGKERTRLAMVDGDWAPMLDDLHAQGAGYAIMGVRFSSWSELITGFRDLAFDLLQKELGREPDRLLRSIKALSLYLEIALQVIGESYLSTKESTIRKQEEAIRELSTPVLKVLDHLLILPIVGIVDTQRARQITESLLNAVRDHRAKAVVMDITGVPMVDSKVANHLVQTVTAARLMGAEVMVTGVSPEIAQTLVTIGARLDGVRTYCDLQGGLEMARNFVGIDLINHVPVR